MLYYDSRNRLIDEDDGGYVPENGIQFESNEERLNMLFMHQTIRRRIPMKLIMAIVGTALAY